MVGGAGAVGASRGRAVGLLLWATAVAVGAVMVVPAVVSAHAAFVSSDPEPGTELSATPGVVVMRFSEPLIEDLSQAVVIDPTGQRFEDVRVGDRQMRVAVRSNAPGTYVVEWKTVSPLDGHTLRGSFGFGVGVAPAGEHGAAPAPRSSDLLLGVARGVEYLGLLAAAGALLVATLGARAPALEWVRPQLRIALGVALVGGVAVVVGETLLAGSPIRYLTTGLPGIARLVRVGAELAAFVLASRGSRFVADFLMVAIVALAGAGHAAAIRPIWWGLGVDAVHLVSAGLWAGGVVALGTLRPPDGWRGREGRELLGRFSPVALAAFAATIVTGSLRATQELSAFEDFFSTSYGQVLGLKILGVVAMIPLSIRAWRRVARSTRGEVLVATAVVALAALLAAHPVPPGRTGEAEAEAEPAAATSAAPLPGDLALAGAVDDVVVGLTLRPGEPGPNEVYVFLVPPGGPEDAEGIDVEVERAERSIPAEACGTTCRVAEMGLEGDETLTVRLEGVQRGEAVFELPALPAADGAELLEEANRRMERVRTYRVDETLAPPRPPIRNDYRFESPDRMHLRTAAGLEVIAVGTTQYRRSGTGDWDVSSDTPAVSVPLYAWKGFEPVAAKEVATETIGGGVEARIVSFHTGDEEAPIWFRLWVDPEGLVRRMQMRARAHIMDQRLFAFDEPMSIEAPEGVRE